MAEEKNINTGKDEAGTKPVPKRAKKLTKVIEGSILTITEGSTATILKFDADKFPEAIQKNLVVYGLSQKIGDAAAGKEGKEAVESMQKVADGLMNGDWSTRAPATKKISQNDLLGKYNELKDGSTEKAVMKGILQKLGVLPADA